LVRKVKNIIDTGIPKVKQYMSETDRVLQVSEVAEYLGVTNSTADGLLTLMSSFGITDKVKRGKQAYYFLKDVYSDEQIRAMLPPEKAPRLPRPRGRPTKPKPSFKDEYLSALEERAGSGEGLSALALLGLPQGETAETLTAEPPEPLPALMGEEKPEPEPLIKSRPFGTVRHLPKEYRRLSQADTTYLKNLLKTLGVCEGLERYNTSFIKFSALKNRRYGEVLYLSTGSNPWDNVRRVTVDPSISDHMVLPIIEARRWVKWNYFLRGLKEKRRYSPGLYDEMLDSFMESGQRLVEITVENSDAAYVKRMLEKKIKERGLSPSVEASRVGEWIYLEKVV